ncbi:hypothetical protein [Thiomicrorhabdus sp. Milos-T2]|uniref:hypothetical protein n=1 Tax=Thiomicrorhabdus sp. Milos-T2 TaxID=90814 RepID=UPI00049451E7|nr:hypothetical protein [Thiomicrorhabdus sp. Milos-T2]
MKRNIRFPIKGTFYYGADIAIDLSLLAPQKPLLFSLEEDNLYDKHAIQVWLPHNQDMNQNKKQDKKQNIKQEMTSNTISNDPVNGLLLGYVPRSLAPKMGWYIKHQGNLELKVIHFAKLGKQIEIDCTVTLDQAWLSYLTLFIQAKVITQLMRFKRFRKHFLS